MSVIIPTIQKYNIIYADCPWDYKRKGGPKHIGMASQVYPTLKDQDIYDLNINELAAEDCFLFSWSTWPKLKEGITAIEKWGFRYVTASFVWIKTNKKSTDTLFWGSGHYTRANTEVCLLGVKGKPKVMNHGVHQVFHEFFNDEYLPETVVVSNVRHSRKPAEVRNRIEKLCGDIPRIELFATQNIEGWTVGEIE
jgi:N6-adenosine-specific RNA methylase IME4